MSSSDVTAAGGCDETLTRTYLFTDACNNTVTCDQIIVRKVDLTAPSATCPTAPVVSACNGAWPAAYATADDFTLAGGTLTDACSTIAMSSSDVTVAGGCDETLTRTYLFTDACNNTVTCDQIIVRKVDITAPSATCPPAPVVSACNGAWPAAYATADDFTLAGGTLTDACSTIAMSSSDVTVAGGCDETLTRTYLFTDACNNTVTCDQIIVRKVDITAPSATCPTAPVVSACNGAWPAAYATADDFTLAGGTLTDACSTIAMSSSDVTVAGGCDETLTRTYLFTDACNNTVTCDQIIVRKVDITAPSATCPPAPVVSACNGAWPAAYATADDFTLAGGTLTDACSTIAMSSSDVTVAGGCDETLTRTYLFTDACNNTVTCDQIIVRKVDITAPSATCPPAPVVSACNGAWPAAYATAADFTLAGGTLTDACSTIAMSSSDVTVAGGCDETLTRTYLFTDACNNTVTCDQIIVRKVDLTAPTASCPAALDLTICDEAWPTAFTTVDDFTLAGGTLTDACSTIAVSSSDVTIASGCNESLTRTYLFTDACNNTATCTQLITRKVSVAIMLTCAADITVSGLASQTDLDMDFASWLGTASVTGGCSPILSNNGVGLAPNICIGGSVDVTFTVSSAFMCDVTTSCVATYTYNSAALPIVMSGSTICFGQSGTAEAAGGTMWVWSTGANTSLITESPVATTTYTVTVTNSLGCTTVSNATIVVNPLPTATALSSSVCTGTEGTLTASGGVSYIWSDGITTSANLVSSVAGSYSVTVTDINGCTATSSASITIFPEEAGPAIGSLTVCQGESTNITLSSPRCSNIGNPVTIAYGFENTVTLLPVISGSGSTLVSGVGASLGSGASGPTFPAGSPSPAMSGTSWNTSVVDPTAYFQFCTNLAPEGCELNLTSLSFVNQRSGTGPPLFDIRVSTTGPLGIFNELLTGQSTSTTIVAPAYTTAFSVNTTSSICFRLYGYGGNVTASAGTWRVDNVTFTGQAYQELPVLCNVYDVDPSSNPAAIPVATDVTVYDPATTVATSPEVFWVRCEDINGCLSQATAVSVTVNALPDITIAGNLSVCTGLTTDLTASGGASYTWSTGATTDLVSVSEGTYTVSVTNAEGCISAKEVTVVLYPAVTAVITGNLTICDGTSTVLTASGGVSSTWSTSETTADITVTTAGLYEVIVTSADGCTSITGVTVVVNPLPSALATNATVCPGATGDLIASGGVSYLWSDASTSATLTTSTVGVYAVTVTDINGCTSSTTAELVNFPGAVALATNATVCPGATGDLIASGGVSYLWIDASTSATLTTSTVAVYTVTVTDINGCTSSTTAELVNFPGAVALATNATVCPGATGDLVASGGVSYLWSDASTSATLTTSTVAVYTVTVTDINGCTSSTTAELVNFPGAVASATSSTVCTGFDGTMTASGGVSYAWSNGPITDINITNVAGTYEVTVTDINGCISTTTATLTINSSAPAAVSNVTVCTGLDGTLSASGGVSYIWSDGTTTSSNFVSSVAGSYTVTVTDMNGCTGVSTAQIINYPLAVATATNATVCPGVSGDLVASGGVSYLWSDASTSATLTTSMVAVYTVTVTDINGCTSSTTAELVNFPGAVASATNATVCPGASGDLVASGGVSFLWSDTSINATLTTSTVGIYSVTVTDINGCISSTTAELVNFPGAVASATSSTVCTGFDGTMTASGGVSYAWSNGPLTENNITNVAGTYEVTVTDINGCISTTTATLTINTNAPAAVSDVSICEGSEGTLTASGGVSYVWSDGITTTSTFVSSVAGTYTVTVTDMNGCTGVSTASILAYPGEAGPAIPSITVCQGESTNITLSSPRCSPIGNPVSIAYGFENTVTLLPVISGSGSTLVAGVGASLGSGATGPTFPAGSPSPSMSGASWNTSVVDPTAYFQFCTDLAPEGCELNLTSLSFVNQRSGTGPPLFDIRVSTTGPLGIFNEILTGQSTSTTIVAPAYTTAFSINTTSSICFRLYGYGGNVTASAGTWRVDNVTFTGQAYQELPVLCNVYDVDPSSNPGAIPVATDVTVYDPATTVATSPEVFWVRCEDINGCLSQATAVSVTVNALPDITIAGNVSVCAGLTTDLTASGGASYTWSTGATTDIVSVAEGTYTVSVTNAEGCTSAKEVTVVLYPAVTALITGNLTICDGTSTVLTASGGVSSTWSTSETTADITVTSAGLYEVIVTSADGCTSISGVTVVVNPLPIVVTTNSTVCEGEAGTLTVSGGASYTWSSGENTSSINPTFAGDYFVTVSSADGCNSTGLATLTVNPLPIVITTNSTVCAGMEGTLTARVFEFAPRDGGPGSFLTSAQTTPEEKHLFGHQVKILLQ
ncbi:MAG: hypothetical protein IPQ18_07835 [Saprospiraceae bacterium]|nr:hypothetical protein [Saprospiraceae bacterium]